MGSKKGLRILVGAHHQQLWTEFKEVTHAVLHVASSFVSAALMSTGSVSRRLGASNYLLELVPDVQVSALNTYDCAQ